MGFWQRLAGVSAGRRSKWLVVVAWVALGVAAGPLAGTLRDKAAHELLITPGRPHRIVPAAANAVA
jgi:hypothetical protein